MYLHSLFLEKNAVKDLKDAVINQDPKVTGALLDSYVAGYWAKVAEDKVLKNPDLRVGTVLDHQFAYGFVIAGLLNNADTEKCMRKKLNSMETEITTIIQDKAETMEVKKFGVSPPPRRPQNSTLKVLNFSPKTGGVGSPGSATGELSSIGHFLRFTNLADSVH